MAGFRLRQGLNMRLSATPGTLKPPAPPETFDQLAALFQFDAAFAIQYRAAIEVFDKLINRSKNKLSLPFLMNMDYVGWMNSNFITAKDYFYLTYLGRFHEPEEFKATMPPRFRLDLLKK